MTSCTTVLMASVAFSLLISAAAVDDGCTFYDADLDQTWTMDAFPGTPSNPHVWEEDNGKWNIGMCGEHPCERDNPAMGAVLEMHTNPADGVCNNVIAKWNPEYSPFRNATAHGLKMVLSNGDYEPDFKANRSLEITWICDESADVSYPIMDARFPHHSTPPAGRFFMTIRVPCRAYVLPGRVAFCPSDGVWPKSLVGDSWSMPCDGGKGNMQRDCYAEGVWGDVVDECKRKGPSAGATVALIVGIGVLAIFVFFVFCHCRRRQEISNAVLDARYEGRKLEATGGYSPPVSADAGLLESDSLNQA